MLQRILIIADASVPDEALSELRIFSSQLADAIQEPVGLAGAGKTRMRAVRAALLAAGGPRHAQEFTPRSPVSAASMGSADFIWREDGRPDWEQMWSGFCELALYGGPPHRGEEAALHASAAAVLPTEEIDAIAEIRRGVWETTGLFAEAADEPGWIAITCHSRKMAAWLCASIILENVDARCEDERLFVPASPAFHLKDEIKSVITVVAKTNHYWQAHIEAREAAARTAGAAD